MRIDRLWTLLYLDQLVGLLLFIMTDTDDAVAQPGDIEFCTLGMFILGMFHLHPREPILTVLCTDDIEFGASQPGVKNVLGGAASFAVVGARLVAGPKYARSVSWIVDVGSDFPPETLAVIKSWGTACVIREDCTRLTTRAWNGYHPNEKRGKISDESLRHADANL